MTKGIHTNKFFPDIKDRLGEKMDSTELLLHTDSDGTWFIPFEATDVWISGKWRLHSVRRDTVEHVLY